jgi:hypothetical protein
MIVRSSHLKISISIALLFDLVTSEPGLAEGAHASHKAPGVSGGTPDVGPVLPLSISHGAHGDLLGAEHSTQMTPNSTAAKHLGRGEALQAPAGRADDFSWPRRDSNVSATPAEKAASDSGVSKTRHTPNADLDGAPSASVGSR